MDNNQAKARRQIPEELQRALSETLQGADPVEQAASTLESWPWYEEARDRNKIFADIADYSRDLWVQASLSAVRSGDIGFFRRVADAYQEEQRQPRTNRAIYFAQLAYAELYQDPNLDPEEIPKCDVRELAKRRWAFSRLAQAGKIAGGFERRFNDKRDRLIEAEVTLLPEVRWQEIWKRPEFSGLKKGKTGPKPITGRKIVDRIHK